MESANSKLYRETATREQWYVQELSPVAIQKITHMFVYMYIHIFGMVQHEYAIEPWNWNGLYGAFSDVRYNKKILISLVESCRQLFLQIGPIDYIIWKIVWLLEPHTQIQCVIHRFLDIGHFNYFHTYWYYYLVYIWPTANVRLVALGKLYMKRQ